MSDENLERRKADEAFRLKIVEQLGEIKTLQAGNNAEIKNLSEKIDEHGRNITNIETALWGYPKSEDAGLLEKNRNQNRKWAITLFVVNVIAWSLLGLLKPLYEKWVTDYIYNSPSQRWAREQNRPVRKHYTVVLPPNNPDGSVQQ